MPMLTGVGSIRPGSVRPDNLKTFYFNENNAYFNLK
jgi:hypothetical protein